MKRRVIAILIALLVALAAGFAAQLKPEITGGDNEAFIGQVFIGQAYPSGNVYIKSFEPSRQPESGPASRTDADPQAAAQEAAQTA